MGLRQTVARYFSRPLLPGPTYGPSRATELRQYGWSGGLPTYQIGKPAYPEQDLVSADAAFRTAATVFACVTYRANAVATACVRAYRGRGRERTPDDAHPLRLLMKRPNPQMSEAEFLYCVQLLTDVADFCVVEKEYAEAGNLIALWPLRPDRLQPIPRRNAAPDWRYWTGDRQNPWRTLASEDVVHFSAGTSMTLPLTGFGPMRLGIDGGALSKALTDYVLAFFQGGGLPPYGLVPRDVEDAGVRVSRTDARVMKEAWKQVVTSGEPPILWSIEKIERLGFDFDELAFDDLHALVDTKICEVFGVPPIVLHTQAGLEASTYSNYAQARRAFYEDTVYPLWARMDGALTRGLLDAGEYGDTEIDLEFDADAVPALQADKGPEEERVVVQWRSRLITRDEARGRLGYPLLAESDDPDGEALGAELYAPVAVPGFGGGGSVAGDDQEDGGGDGEEGDDEGRWFVDFLKGNGAIHPRRRSPRNGHGPAEYRAVVGAANRDRIAAVAERAAPWYRAFFRAQGDRVAAAAKRSTVSWRNTGPRWDSWLPESRDIAEISWQEEEEALEKILRRHHALAGETAYAAAADALGVSIAFDLANHNVRSVMDRLALRVVGINAQTRQDVADVTTKALSDGVDLPELLRRLTGLFEETYAGRPMTVARTESMTAFGEASLLAYRESGLVDRVELLDNPAHTESYGASDGLSCAERHNLVVPLDQASTHIAAEHPNGSLSLAPVLIGED